MHVKFGTLFVVCLVFGFLAGNASACRNDNLRRFRCNHGTVFRGWVVRNNRCSLARRFIPDRSCRNCTIDSRTAGVVRLTTPGGTTYTCNYGPGGYSRCEAYCMSSRGGISSTGGYECFTRNDAGNLCSCSGNCRRYNP